MNQDLDTSIQSTSAGSSISGSSLAALPQKVDDIEMKVGPMVAPMPSMTKVDTETGEEQEESAFLTKKERVIEVIKMEPTQSQIRASKPLEVDTETEEQINMGHLVVTDKTQTGKLINAMFTKWEHLKKNQVHGERLKPWYRGNMLCFCYIGDEPFFTIGPDYKMSLFEIFMTNFLMFLVVRQNQVEAIWYLSIGVLVLKNFFFILTCTLNPGMIPRNPNVHSKDYLRHIAQYDQMEYICTKCNLILPYTNVQQPGRKVKFLGKTKKLGTPDNQKIHHCCACGVCYVGYDHHCIWSGKCIASGNLHVFYGFLTMLSIMLVLFWVNLILGSMTHHGRHHGK